MIQTSPDGFPMLLAASVCASLIPSHLLKQEREKPEAHSNQQSRSDEEG